VAQAGAEPVPMGIVPDDLEVLREAIVQAVASADLVLSSGGVSVGDYDYVDQILDELGAEIHIRSVAIKPGKPLTVATLPTLPITPSPHHPITPPLLHSSTLYFGLPGNPASALVCFWRFVQPALKKLSGFPEPWEVSYVNAITVQPLNSDRKRDSYVWGQLELMNGSYQFKPAGGSHSSGNLINLIGTNGLAVIPAGEAAIVPGDIIHVLPIP
ncbi:molybdopterin-binding protein, partial [Leptodesmis sp.]|uniref:molybdopterin-binding protein n=1 Tax=Leptodesmis sp. TaxID=3100501 RepID=UPI0040534C86